MERKVLYEHYKPDTDEIFYVGIGGPKRPYGRESRNIMWQRIVAKYGGFDVRIVINDLTWEQACDLEIFFIAVYGRRDLNLGPLTNMTDGGDGVPNLSDASRNKMIQSRMGNKNGVGNTNFRGKSHTEENKVKLTAVLAKNRSDNSKLVLNTATGIYYDSAREAATAGCINPVTLTNQLNGRYNNKTHFIYV
jgi:hypothetical protein